MSAQRAGDKRYVIHVVDVFTDKPLAGNQLAVVLDAEGIPGDVMQRIAKEMNISETVFVLAPEDPANAARVRIFTPGAELPFAGHPTIGTSWVLFTQGLIRGGALEFKLEEGVGPEDAKAVDSAVSEKDRLAKVFKESVFLFAAVGPDRLYSRMFSPHVLDIHEDPATGSGSGPLGAFAVRYGLVPRAPAVAITSEQGTKMGRQSFIHIRLEFAADAELPSSIQVGGSVVPTLTGELAGGW